ncbi:MAG: MBL fold metallo-hydrolase [Myxococcales bacterium]|nr:MBL fold metallo-hydrolase [Myxococcales bacterium]
MLDVLKRFTPRWPAVLPFLLSPKARHKNDSSAASDTNWRHFDVELPPGLEIQWLGTAGFRLSYQGTDIVTDPYISRASFTDVARRRALLPLPERVERFIPRVDAVLVGHTHFDHAVDVPYLAERYGATIYGSRSMVNLLSIYGLAHKGVHVEHHKTYEIGPFEVTFVPSLHSKLVLGLQVPYEGELSCEHVEALTGPSYRCGQVYGIHIKVGGVTFYHQGSCNLIDDEVRHHGIDYFLAGIAGRGFTERYWTRILSRLEPRFVVPHHHDNFFLPVDEPMGFSFNVNYGSFVEEIRAVSSDFAIRSLDLLQTVRGPER